MCTYYCNNYFAHPKCKSTCRQCTVFCLLSTKCFVLLPGRIAQSEVLGSIPGLATYFSFSFRSFKRAVVSYWRKYVHEVLVNSLGGLSLPRKSVVRLTDLPDMTLAVYHGRKTTAQQQQQQLCTVYFLLHPVCCVVCTVCCLQ